MKDESRKRLADTTDDDEPLLTSTSTPDKDVVHRQMPLLQSSPVHKLPEKTSKAWIGAYSSHNTMSAAGHFKGYGQNVQYLQLAKGSRIHRTQDLFHPVFIGEGKSGFRTVPSFNMRVDEDVLPEDALQGLCNIKAVLLLSLWYFFSFSTLFLNKYILSYLKGDPTVLGNVQLMATTVFGFIQMYVPCGLYTIVEREGKPPRFILNMVAVGTMRFITVILGLVALKYVAVSFTETIKSSAPLFTVMMARCILSETTGWMVNLSLVPVMGGLALCTVNEVSFNLIGFLAALSTNIVECLQNVYSKMLISGEKYKYTPAELQFYTSLAAVVVQLPVSYFFVDLPQVRKDMDSHLAMAFLLDGVFFHFHSITAYALMSYISPITHSVANTAKRASLIWLSVIVFGNPVTLLSGLGSLIVIIGVLMYTKARQLESSRLASNCDKLIKA